MFTARKVAQMAAFFATRQGGRIYILKLIKLMYLADRESISRYGSPITFDSFFSLDNGPILSRTLNLISGLLEGSEAAAWDEWIRDRSNHMVSATQDNLKREDLDELSEADLEVIEHVWAQFGKMDRWTIRDYTHDHCSEWEHPQGSRKEICDRDILIAVGADEDKASELSDDILAQRNLDKIFASL